MRLKASPARLLHFSFISVVLGLLSCGPTSKTPASSPTARSASALEQYLPLRHDTISQFEMVTDGGEPGMFVLEISRPRDNLAELRIAGHVQRLELTPTRIVHATGGTLLEEPLTVGHHFRGAFGEVTITDLHHSIDVPAGHFEQCLVTVEESTTAPRRATSVYCPEVGLVALTVESFGAEAGLVENKLMQHAPRYR
jgi:hypothetical protein